MAAVTCSCRHLETLCLDDEKWPTEEAVEGVHGCHRDARVRSMLSTTWTQASLSHTSWLWQ